MGSRREWAGATHFGSASHLVNVGLFLLALGPRLVAAWGRFITSDELAWVYRSTRFLTALSTGNWAQTSQAGHPGVTTMWCGVVGILLRRLTAPGAATEHLAWLAHLNWDWFDPYNVPALKQMAFFLVAGRLPVAILTSLAVVGIYLLARRLWGQRVALLGAVLLALDPFPVGLSAVLHVDALTASFMTLSLLALLVGVQETNLFRWVVLSGALAGLAMLTKSPAIFLVPFTALVLVVTFLQRREKTLRLGAAFFLWLAVTVLTFCALYPAMWVSPGSTLQLIFGTAERHADSLANLIFFRGRTVADPGPLFYPIALAFRTSPVVWCGVLLALPLLLPRRKTNWLQGRRFSLLTLLLFALLFIAFMTSPVKKFDRYLMPIFPALDLVAATGLVGGAEWLSHRWRLGLLVVLATAVVLQAVIGLPYAPYFLAYENPLLGGPKGAAKILPVGWGEGLDRAAVYLNGLEGAESMYVVTEAGPHFAPMFAGKTLRLDEANLPLADYLVVSVEDRQVYSARLETLLTGAELMHTVRLGNLDYVQVYANTAYRLADAYVAERVQPGDVIVLDAAGERYAGGLPFHVFIATDDADTVACGLNKLARGQQRLWYLSYPQASPILKKYIASQLSAGAELVSQEKVGAVTVSLYRLPSGVTFEAPAREFEANFGGQLALVDHALLTPGVAYPGQVRLALRWKALAPMADDYTVFVNLLDQDGHLRGTGGGGALLTDEAFPPTSTWTPGDVVDTEISVSLESGLPPGFYQLVVVVSKLDQSKRLVVLDAQGAPAGIAYEVEEVEVLPASEQPPLEQLTISRHLSQVWDDGLELLGYNLAGQVDAGGTVTLGLFWRGQARMDRDYELRLQLRAADGRAVWESIMPLCPYPTSRWSPGEVFHVLYDLKIGVDVPAGQYWLVMAVFDGEAPLSPGDFDLASLEVTSRVHRFDLPGAMQHPLDMHLGANSEVRLLGYDLPQTEVAPGDEVRLTLYWRCESPVDTSYTVFTHLLDPDGLVRGQVDRPPQGGEAPTTTWLAGEIIVDEYHILVDGNAPAGEYHIEVGMYDPATIIRLPVFAADGSRLPDDRVLLETAITVR
ncbi:MAG: glycosyltransferase family 39 protein [Anaerolineae bacterium]|nr:glycosyltransferase family 39 protein [Anaerolineae bacterium]